MAIAFRGRLQFHLKQNNDGNERIVKGFKKRMGEQVKVAVEMVENIPRDSSGKYRYVVSKVAGSLQSSN